MQKFHIKTDSPKGATRTKRKISATQRQKQEDVNLHVMLLNSVRILDSKVDYRSLVTEFLEIFFLWRKSEGIVSAVKRLKLNHQALLNFVNKSVKAIPYIRLTSDGFPKGLLCFRNLVRSRKIKDLNIINTLCRFHRNFIGDGKTVDLRSITDTSPTPYNVALSDEIRLMCRRLIGNRTLKRIKIEDLKPTFFISGKGGPSGPALLRAQGCLSAMKNGDLNDQRLLSHLMDLGKSLNFNEIDDVLSVTKDSISEGEYHSRLRCKQDKSTKNRIFAIVDYLTQVLLKPLNDELFDILGGFGEADATFDQNKIVPYAEKHSFPNCQPENFIFSIDLSKATDRLKRGYYKVILEELTGSDVFAEQVILCMTDRRFFYEGQTYQYAEGQGMGTYCSWPLMALLHHIIVQIAALRAGFFKYKGKSDIYKDYILLGDDLTLKGLTVYENYAKIINEVEENLLNGTKSILNCKGSLNMIEFASRFFFQGKEITGISTNIVRDLSKRSLDGPLVPLINLCSDISHKLKDNKDELVTIISRLSNIHKMYKQIIKRYPTFFHSVIKIPSLKRSDLICRESFEKLIKILTVFKMYRSLNDDAANASKKIVSIVYLSPLEKDSYDCPRDEDGELLDDSILSKALQQYQIGKTRKMRGWLDKQFIKSLGTTNPSETECNDSGNALRALQETFDPMGEFDTLSNYISMNLTRREVVKLKNRRIKMLSVTLSQFQKAMRLWKLTSYRSELVVISGSKEQMLLSTLSFDPLDPSKNTDKMEEAQAPLLRVRERSDIAFTDVKALDAVLPALYISVLNSERKAGWLTPVEQEITKPFGKGVTPPPILLDLDYPQCGYESGQVQAKRQRKALSQASLVAELSKLSLRDRQTLLESLPREGV